ncbi:glycoside hydrolase family 71/99-like protein [Cyclobacterium plantarum]|uniref:Xylosidase n=1 Tax=Cyclobacterium plantarum TaxID=2716263 RepID=A0ABX0HF91_9BACT|nr:glycoside hydrolase family 71/99-like protein [Cyclobacterium plantarum]NHE58700.1 xylosidase [Cyclobacterium plantarum]
MIRNPFDILTLLCIFSAGCIDNQAASVPQDPDEPAEVTEIVYDETGLLYTSLDQLVMAGYQGWFAAEGDGSDRGWYHYQRAGKFEPGFSTIDFWPEVKEYSQTYETAFRHQDGSPAFVYSPYDEESVDLHFKWMKDYGIDGVHVQRFVVEIKEGNAKGKRHFNKVLSNALKAAKKYDRAISVMYDLSGSTPEDVAYLKQDWEALQAEFNLFDNEENPTYVRHNGKPLVTIWGVGFNDNRKYTIEDVGRLVEQLKGPENKVSIMLGVPYYWRTLNRDTTPSTALHDLIKKVDVIMPWAVGRYNSESYANTAGGVLSADMQWCKNNNVDYIPLAFPGFTWGNLRSDPDLYDQIPRNEGEFLWKQVAGAKQAGASSLYVAMFDEVDEGTAIFKCLKKGEVPLNGSGKFMGIEESLDSDYYLWLTGQATRWFHGEGGFGPQKPIRH